MPLPRYKFREFRLFGTPKINDGDLTYHGQIKNHKYDGKGKLTFQNADYYVGDLAGSPTRVNLSHMMVGSSKESSDMGCQMGRVKLNNKIK